MKKFNVRISFLASIVALSSTIVACGPSSGDSVNANGMLLDRTTQALSSGALLFANGTYTDCVARSGAWSLALDGFSASLPGEELSVVKDDTGCVLTLTSLVTGVESTPLEWVENDATPDIAMDDTFEVNASSFANGAFYANARMNAVSYADDFTIAVLFSDDPDLAATGADTASFIVSSASATSSDVPAPNYTITMTDIAVQTDAADVVEVATGTAQLNAGSATGEAFVVLSSSPGTAYEDIDAAYLAASPALLSTLTTLQIPVANFDLIGADLTTAGVRYVVLSRTDNGVRSYQVITVTFNHA